jgi:hypothetical protein
VANVEETAASEGVAISSTERRSCCGGGQSRQLVAEQARCGIDSSSSGWRPRDRFVVLAATSTSARLLCSPPVATRSRVLAAAEVDELRLGWRRSSMRAAVVPLPEEARRVRREDGRRTEKKRRAGAGAVGSLTVGMGKAPESPRMRLLGGLPAKCSNRCGSCWSRYSDLSFCILQMQRLIQQLLETVLSRLASWDGTGRRGEEGAGAGTAVEKQTERAGFRRREKVERCGIVVRVCFVSPSF